MKIHWTIRALALLAVVVNTGRAEAAAERSDDRVEALIELLQERGILGGDDAQLIIQKNREYEDQRSWLSRLSFFGDFRGRYERFWNDDRRDRQRIRYRLRLGAKADINDHVDLEVRLASGGAANSRNTTLGDSTDFMPDGIHIDKAFLKLQPFGEASVPIPTATKWRIDFGKMSNPFNSKKLGKDLILWDGDHTPEGIATTIAFEPCDCFDFNLDLGYFVIQEMSSGRDPELWAAQLDTRAHLSDDLSATNSLSYYHWNDLDSDFFDRNINRSNNSSFYGNTGGLSGGGDTIDVLDYRVTIGFKGVQNVPVLAYGRIVKNLSATIPAPGFGKQNLAWSLGLELGDKRKNARIGAGYFYVEADAVPSSITDSDLFDGHTNAEGWLAYATRQIWTNTELAASVFLGDIIETGLAPTGTSTRFERVRVQGDIKVKF